MTSDDSGARRGNRWLAGASAWSVVGLAAAVGFFQIMGTIGAAEDQPERASLDVLAAVASD